MLANSFKYLRKTRDLLLRFGLASCLLLGLLFLLWSCSTKNLVGTVKLGSILVDSNIPGAFIDLNDNPTEKQTPDTLKNIPVGKHKVSIRKEGYNSVPEFDSVEVIDGGLATVEFFLTNKVGAISVDSDPQGAKIILDQINTQKLTPDTLDSVPVGKHVVSVERDGYKASPESDTQEVVEDSVSEVGFVLV